MELFGSISMKSHFLWDAKIILNADRRMAKRISNLSMALQTGLNFFVCPGGEPSQLQNRWWIFSAEHNFGKHL
jgi:hypothetical protein